MSVIYDTVVHHTRRSPVRHAFTYRSRSWLVDLDALPAKGFRSQDHLSGDAGSSLRQRVDELLSQRGLRAAQVLLLTSPRQLGHVFNPLSVFWCLDRTGQLIATVAEVHNTYGGRHAYLLAPGQQRVDKAFAVSPFHRVEGWYELHLPIPDERVRLDVVYHTAGSEPFIATVRGTLLRTDRAGWRDLLTTRLVAARIRLHGIRLLLRGLPVTPRPRSSAHQESS